MIGKKSMNWIKPARLGHLKKSRAEIRSDKQHHNEGDACALEKEKIRRPHLYKVLLHNDDYTTMEFVLMVLRKLFYKSEAEALHTMLTVHHKGVGVAGVYTRETSETKVNQVNEFARAHQHPLKCSMEPE